MPVPGVPTSGSDYAYPSYHAPTRCPWPLREENPLLRLVDPYSNLFQTLGHLFASAAEKPLGCHHDIVINHLILRLGFDAILCRLSSHISRAKVYSVSLATRQGRRCEAELYHPVNGQLSL